MITSKLGYTRRGHYRPRQPGSFLENKAATIIQTAWRKKEAQLYANSIKKRLLLALEMRDNEMLYVTNIAYVNVLYEQPLRDLEGHGTPVIPAEKIKQIFQNIQELIKLHSILSSSLNTIIKDWAHDSIIGDLYALHAPTMERLYMSYVLNYPTAIQILSKTLQSNSDLKAFIKEQRLQDPNLKSLTLQDLLMMPVQRIPRVELLLSNLWKHTRHRHRDYGPLEQTLQMIHNVSAAINDQKAVLETHHREAKVIQLLEECGLTSDVTRNLVSEFDVVELNRTEKGKNRKFRRIFVLTDSIICTKTLASEASALIGDSNFKLLWLAVASSTTASHAIDKESTQWERARAIVQLKIDGKVDKVMAALMAHDIDEGGHHDCVCNLLRNDQTKAGKIISSSHGESVMTVSGKNLVTWLLDKENNNNNPIFTNHCEDLNSLNHLNLSDTSNNNNTNDIKNLNDKDDTWLETVVLAQELLDKGMIAPVGTNGAVFMPSDSAIYCVSGMHIKEQEPLAEVKERIEDLRRNIVIERRIADAATKLISAYKGTSTKLLAKKQHNVTTKSMAVMEKQLQDLQGSILLYTPQYGVHLRTPTSSDGTVYIHTVYTKEKEQADRLIEVINKINIVTNENPLSASPHSPSTPTSGRRFSKFSSPDVCWSPRLSQRRYSSSANGALF
eukprot:Ihof_evm3s483 gene=Ihof_evmTU3s483